MMKSLFIMLAASGMAQPRLLIPALPSSFPTVMTTSSLDQVPAPPKASGGPSGPICECGYTYYASVLMKMSMPPLTSPWSLYRR